MSTEWSRYTKPNDFGITHLRHVDFAIPDFGKQRDFYTSLWGLKEEGTDGNLAYLACEGSPENYSVRLREGDKRLDLISFGMRDAAAVDAFAEHLLAKGAQLITKPDVLQTMGGGYGFRFFDVDGRALEVSANVATRTARAIEEREPIPVRLSHVVINSPDIDVTKKWYEDVLGFKHSDSLWTPHMGTLMYFMRCNDWHHSLAIAKGPHASLHHVSFEMRGIDEYMRASGKAIRSGVKKIWGPGRHGAGDNTFTYFLDPSGNTNEYTTALEVITADDRHPFVFDVSQPANQDQWGTANPFDELVARDSFNDPDPMFAAPPV